MRAMAKVLVSRLESFKDQGFLLPQPGREDDEWYSSKLTSEESKVELVDFCLHFGFDNPAILRDLVAISFNLEASQEGDTQTEEFVRGRRYLDLFNHFCMSIAPLATTCVIVELLFSQMKNVQKANETSQSVDEELMLIFNVCGSSRLARRSMLEHTKSGKGRHVHTLAQIQELCKQALEMLDRYSEDAMQKVPGRRSFIGSLAAADIITASRGATVKDQKRSSRKQASDLSPAVFAAAHTAAFAAPLGVQRQEATLLAIAPRQRIFSVVMEEKNYLQRNNETAFWSKIKGGVKGMKLELSRVLPLISGIVSKFSGISAAISPSHLADKVVTMVTTRGQRRVFQDGNWVPSLSQKPRLERV
jgi:hypothetical protein